MTYPICSDLEAFIDEVVSIFPPDPVTILAALIISILSIKIVQRLGNYSLMDYCLEPYDGVSRAAAVANIVYRIVAPSIASLLLYFVCGLLLELMGADIELGPRWIACFFYWLILICLKIVKHTFLAPFSIVLESLLSVMLTLIFDLAVIGRLYDTGFTIFDSSNIAYQFILAILYMIIYSIAAYFQDQTGLGKQTANVEKALYSYRARFAPVIKKSKEYIDYYNSYIFRSIFYTIMYIEDRNRPATIRRLENILCRFGIAKTTGIMQCRGIEKKKKPLTDNESVLVALSEIVKMWDGFVKSHVLSESHAASTGKTWITDAWYSIESDAFETIFAESFSEFYGSYRGSKLLSCNQVFRQVLEFEKRELMHAVPGRMSIRSDLFTEVSAAFPEAIVVVENGALHPYGHTGDELEKGQGVIWLSEWNENAHSEYRIIAETLIKDGCHILDVNIVENFYIKVVYQGSYRGQQQLEKGWYHYKVK